MKFTGFTNKGSRSVNDDYCADANANGIHLFAVADGMGENGRLASELVVKTIVSEFESSPELSHDALQEYIMKARRLLRERKSFRREYDTADTTLAVLMIAGSRTICAHCGDTRIYMLRHGSISDVTEDHSEAFEKFKAGNIEFSEIRKSPLRHRLRRAIGDGISWECDISDIIKTDPSCSFLVCTDGFWSLITEKEIEKCSSALSSKRWLGKMLEIIFSRMNEKSDNLTAYAIRLQVSDML